MKKLALLLFGLAVLCAPMLAQPVSYNTILFDQLDPMAERGNYRYSGVTGYRAPDGREYAIVGGYDGTHIIDVTSKPIKEITFIPGEGSIWREMKTWGRYAYVVTEGGGGLQIIDLSQLPAKATLVRTDTAHFNTAHTIVQEGHYLYINGTDPQAGANGGTMIFALDRNPLEPELVGMWTGRYVHDCAVRNDTLYAAAINDGRLDIVYLGPDRSNPEFVTDIRYPGAGTHNADLSVDGRWLFTTDEVGGTPKTLKVWDLNNLDEITKAADFTPAPGQIIHNVHVKENLAFVSWYTAGTRIIDISNPREPLEVAYYDTYAGSANVMLGNWEVYPYLPSGKILASDITGGLVVFTFDSPGKLEPVFGTVRDSATGQPIVGAQIDVPAIGRAIRTGDDGAYRFTGLTGTVYTAEAGAWGWVPKSVRLSSDAAGTPATIELRRGYADDAELDLGWALSAPDDDAATGGWERGTPVLMAMQSPRGIYTVQPGEDHTPGEGRSAFTTQITDSELGPGASDVDSGKVSLTSPSMDLSGYADPYFNYALWYRTDPRHEENGDTLRVLFSIDGGESWQEIAREIDSLRGWTEFGVRIRDFANPTARVLFRVVAEDRDPMSLVEAGLDDFSVTEGPKVVSGIDDQEEVAGIRVVARPNPMTGEGTIEVLLERGYDVARLELFDVLGRRVALLHQGTMNPGGNSFRVDGASLGAGRYTWRLTLDGGVVRSGAVTIVR